ncbi:NAD-dependent protein deacetylase SIR2 [Phanerochaete sordida]|uniref:NAD-dependent protein deacetylase SIR2 n=1 Tax=Phanerochaete sordida TaxID=48140 RepID=A0A9P3FZ25_9APHY|nr:NAD-dependent protein deacetylase SIR2 [Phanerochaete sordida]
MLEKFDLDNAQAEPLARRALTNLSLSVAKCKKIVVVTGAGISCSCGIPDFRSSDGLYALVKQQYPDVVLKGRDLFDASLFRDATSTAVFYTFISQLKQSIDRASPSPTHKFLKTLDAKGKLLRSYTQNIDGFEEQVGLAGSSSQEPAVDAKGKGKLRAKDVRNVQLHGDIHRVRCTLCSAEFPCTPEYLELFNQGIPPDCVECASRSKAREARAARALKVGTLRPAIVLYDEPHPLGDDIGVIQSADLARRPDMLIIMGTSLKVHGFKKLVKEFARAVHESAPPKVTTLNPPPKKSSARSHAGKVIFVNKTPPGAEWEGIIDVWVQAESDRWVEKVAEDWKKAVPGDWETQQRLDGLPGASGGPFKVMKELNGAGQKGKGKRNENIPPDVISLACLTPLPDSPPPSPGKRRTLTCHYGSDDEGECNPAKKRASSRVRGDLDLDDLPTGLLFGNAANTRMAKKEEVEDVFTSGPDVKERSRPKSRAGAAAKGGVAKARSQSRPKATSSGQRGKTEGVTQSRRTRAGTKVR